MTEEWRAIEGYDAYEVSNFGRVRSKDRYVNIRSYGQRLIPGQILKGESNQHRHGYWTVSLCSKSKHRNFQIHRLVAQAFIPNPENKPQVNHIDNNPSNNRVDNLEWVTAQENVDWMIKCGRQVSYKRPIKATNIETGEVLMFESSIDAARHGFQRPSIWRNMTGEYSHHKGYVFEFID